MRIYKADQQRLTTTLYRLRKYNACNEPRGDEPGRYDHLVAALGPGYGDRKPINLLTILEHNGVDDMLWALRTVPQNCNRVARLMAAAFAWEVLPIFEAQYPQDKRARHMIAVACRYARGKVIQKEFSAGRLGWPGWSYLAPAASRAARDAAKCAVLDCATHSAWLSAAAARRAEQIAASDPSQKQSQIIRRLLLTDEEAA